MSYGKTCSHCGYTYMGGLCPYCGGQLHTPVYDLIDEILEEKHEKEKAEKKLSDQVHRDAEVQA